MEELNQEQKKAVLSNNKHIMVLAGAGTGKTKTIIHKIKHLIENNHVPSKIAVLTFTRKAANEILYRLSAYLGGQSAAVVKSKISCVERKFSLRCSNSAELNRFVKYCTLRKSAPLNI